MYENFSFISHRGVQRRKFYRRLRRILPEPVLSEHRGLCDRRRLYGPHMAPARKTLQGRPLRPIGPV